MKAATRSMRLPMLSRGILMPLFTAGASGCRSARLMGERAAYDAPATPVGSASNRMVESERRRNVPTRGMATMPEAS